MDFLEFIALYTHQKTKKKKIWKDGVLKIDTNRNKATLIDDHGQILDALYLKGRKVNVGDDLESDRYLITVEEAKATGNQVPCPSLKASQQSGSHLNPPLSARQCLPVGLKRKHSGYRVPQQIQKKATTEENKLSSAQLHQCISNSSHSPKFYNQSPLFATITNKQTTTITRGVDQTIGTHLDVPLTDQIVQASSSSASPDLSFLPTPKSCVEPSFHPGLQESIEYVTDKEQNLELLQDLPTFGHFNSVSSASKNIRNTAQILALLGSDKSQKDALPKCDTTSVSKSFKANPFIDQKSSVLCRDSKSVQPEELSFSLSHPSSAISPKGYLSNNISFDYSVHREADVKLDCKSIKNDDLLCAQDPLSTACKLNSVYQSKLSQAKRSKWEAFLPEKKMEAVECNDILVDLDDSTISHSHTPNVPFCSVMSSPGECDFPSVNFSLLEDFSLDEMESTSAISSDLKSEEDLSNPTDKCALRGIIGKSEQHNLEGMDNLTLPCADVHLAGKDLSAQLSSERRVNNQSTGNSVQTLHTSATGQELMVNELTSSHIKTSKYGLKQTLCGSPAYSGNQQLGDYKLSETPYEEKSHLEFGKCLRNHEVAKENSPRLPLCGRSKCEKPEQNLEIAVGRKYDLQNSEDPVNETINQITVTQAQGENTPDLKTDDNFHSFPEVNHDKTRGLKMPVIPQGFSTASEYTLSGSTGRECCGNESAQLPFEKEEHLLLLKKLSQHSSALEILEEITSSCGQLDSWTRSSVMDKTGVTKEAVDLKTAPICKETIHEFSASQTSFKMSDTLEEPVNSAAAPFQWLSPTSDADMDFESSQWSFWEPKHPSAKSPAQQVPLQSAFLLRSYNKDGESASDLGACRETAFGHTSSVRVPAFTPQTACNHPEVPPDTKSFSDANKCSEVEQCLAVSSLNCFHKHSPSLSFCRVRPGDIKGERAFCKEGTEAGTQEPRLSTIQHVTSQERQSKWLKYQNTSTSDRIAQNSGEWSGTTQDEKSGRKEAVMQKDVPEDPLNIHLIKETLVKQYQPVCEQGIMAGKWVHSLNSGRAHPGYNHWSKRSASSLSGASTTLQKTVLEELSFPSGAMVSDVDLPKRQIHIPTSFQSCTHYKHVFAAALTEHLNILLFDLAQKLHKALSKVDISPYTAEKTSDSNKKGPVVPLCHHKEPAQLAIVKKCGQNQGRFYYTCNAPNLERCNFFKWLDDVNAFSMQGCNASSAKMVMSDVASISVYIRSQHIPLYSQSHLLIRKSFDFQRKRFQKGKSNYNNESLEDAKPKLYLKLSRKESSSSYSKDDLWVVSKTLLFDPHDTFIAFSAFFGPSSTNELEIVPIKGYHPSNWLSDAIVHALLVCNASTELTSLRNLQENFLPASMPLMPYLLKIRRGEDSSPAARMLRAPKLQYTGRAVEMASEMIDLYHLNGDQAAALFRVAKMMGSNEKSGSASIQDQLPITIIHGVFGAGKSFLLAVIVLFLVHLFAETEQAGCPNSTRWKLLISSSTNVSVDRVLLSLLDLGFDKFIRVGSVRKIAKRVLPYSLHAGSESEQLRELQSLLKMNLSSVEKIYVRKSIEQHKLGRNKALLREVQVVGATCAACPFPCMNNLLFPVVLLDECSQITEPASMLPIARFGCEKLVLVGDPKQLPPTIQGSEATHAFGIEQTLFDRMCLMGHEPILLRSQYRCHPAISKLANELFYSGALVDGIAESDRRPLVDWLPTLCFCSVAGTEQIEKDGSFHNIKEALFTLKLIQTLIAAGIEGTLIGVITLYKSQMNKICSLIYSNTCCNHREVKLVQVSTVDAFQGAEKEVIILSCVRTRHVGFTDSERRMNVALTRGKRHLLILGNLACLQKNVLWRRVISHCQGQENGLKHSQQFEGQLESILQECNNKRNEQNVKLKERNVSQSKVINQIENEVEVSDLSVDHQSCQTEYIKSFFSDAADDNELNEETSIWEFGSRR
ncbi:protein ZGRF1-like [Polypterus senegalus]|uniref:protein ZGRF1-like n=1 Tax=Polypterus senegalus TaxID=55291 RepID=UPI0019661DD7|nr:protein ZGRF1-like [Polypterus senegalus]